MKELLTDPKGESSCSTRRRMAWAIWAVGVGCIGSAVFLAAAGQDTALLSTIVQAGAVMVLGGPLIYYLGRAALERVIAGAVRTNVNIG